MLVTFLYHEAKDPEALQTHLKSLSKYPIVLPGDSVPFFRRSFCLTFDDAYADFYHVVFPLLKKLKMRALLAVPVKFILPSTDLPIQERLSCKNPMQGNLYREKAPFCTWEEIREMQESGYVQIASHSFSHPDLSQKEVDLEKEIVHSKRILEERLGIRIDTFVYPFGKFTKEVHAFTRKHYRFAMRIGSACNLSWGNGKQLIYRISRDKLNGKKLLASSIGNLFLNLLRGR